MRDLSYRNFAGLILSGADFSDADLTGANFAGANLTGANFKHARLIGANFEGANLTGANFAYADLTGATLPDTMVTAVLWTWAPLPDGYTFDKKGHLLENGEIVGWRRENSGIICCPIVVAQRLRLMILEPDTFKLNKHDNPK